MKNDSTLWVWDNPRADGFLYTNNLWLPKGIDSSDFWNADGWYTEWEGEYMTGNDRQRMYTELAHATAQCSDWSINMQVRLLDEDGHIIEPRLHGDVFNNDGINISRESREEAEMLSYCWRTSDYDGWEWRYLESPVLVASRKQPGCKSLQYNWVDVVIWWNTSSKDYTLIVNLQTSQEALREENWEVVFDEAVTRQVRDILDTPKEEWGNEAFESILDRYMDPENRDEMYSELENIWEWIVSCRLECEWSSIIMTLSEKWRVDQKFSHVGSRKKILKKGEEEEKLLSPYDMVLQSLEEETWVDIRNTTWWIRYDRTEVMANWNGEKEYTVVFSSPPEVLEHIVSESEYKGVVHLNPIWDIKGKLIPVDHALYQDLRWYFIASIIPSEIRNSEEYTDQIWMNGYEQEFRFYEVVYDYIFERLGYFFWNSRELKAGHEQLIRLTNHLNRVIQEELSGTIFEWFKYTSDQYVDIAMAIRKWNAFISGK